MWTGLCRDESGRVGGSRTNATGPKARSGQGPEALDLDVDRDSGDGADGGQGRGWVGGPWDMDISGRGQCRSGTHPGYREFLFPD